MTHNRLEHPSWNHLIAHANYFGARHNIRTESLLLLLYVAENGGFDRKYYEQLWNAAYTPDSSFATEDFLHLAEIEKREDERRAAELEELDELDEEQEFDEEFEEQLLEY